MKKRLLGGLLAVTAVMALASCGTTASSETSTTTTGAETTTPTTTTTEDNSTKAWQELHVADSYDTLVDQAIEYYATHAMKDVLSTLTSYEGNYWKIISVYTMKSNGYDATIYNYDMLTQEFKDSVANADVADLPHYTSAWPAEANFAKFYYAARAIGYTDLDAYKTAYTTYLDSKTAYVDYDEYTYPFTLSIAKALGLESHIASDIINTTYRPAKEGTFGVNGPEGLAWQLTGLSTYKELAASELAPLDLSWVTAYADNYGVPEVSLSSYLLAYAALDANPRTAAFDIVKTLFDSYYDKETHQFAIEKDPGDYSSEQIYAALIAYKVCKDKKKAVNLFA